jgi:hypothetical protein
MAGRRAAEILVGLFALLGFVCVPLGQKTGFEHLVAIGSTPAVLQAAADLWSAAQHARTLATRALGAQIRPAAPPAPSSSQRPSPVVPHFGKR